MTPDALTTSLLEILLDRARAERAAGFARVGELDELVAREGEQFEPQPLPRGVRRCKPRSCHRAALTLALRRDDLDYVEGFAISRDVSDPILHAWCADAEGRVIDRVWPEPGREYVGFRIPIRLIPKHLYGNSILWPHGAWGTDERPWDRWSEIAAAARELGQE